LESNTSTCGALHTLAEMLLGLASWYSAAALLLPGPGLSQQAAYLNLLEPGPAHLPVPLGSLELTRPILPVTLPLRSTSHNISRSTLKIPPWWALNAVVDYSTQTWVLIMFFIFCSA
jgi:hypothetical protein